MSKTTDEEPITRSIFFSCGYAVNRDTIVAPAQYNAYPDAYMSRVALKLGDQWANHDVDQDLIGSISFNPKENRLWLLGRLGCVRTVATGANPFTFPNIRGQFKEENIATDNFGELLCIKAIGNEVLACGQSLQIYRRQGNQWRCDNPEMREMAAPALESIDGSAPDDLYAVGEKGTILHYNGKAWQECESPTNRPLSRVYSVSRDEVYICGNDGLIFKGNKDQWDYIGDPDFTKNFWDLAIYKDQLYLSHVNGLVTCNQGVVAPVSPGVEKEPNYHRLHANDGVLWSFGIDDLMVFDGEKWRLVICPENV